MLVFLEFFGKEGYRSFNRRGNKRILDKMLRSWVNGECGRGIGRFFFVWLGTVFLR